MFHVQCNFVSILEETKGLARNVVGLVNLDGREALKRSPKKLAHELGRIHSLRRQETTFLCKGLERLRFRIDFH